MDRVILYSEEGNASAARTYWMFKIFGHKRVSILNGGLKKWVKEGRSVEGSREDTN